MIKHWNSISKLYTNLDEVRLGFIKVQSTFVQVSQNYSIYIEGKNNNDEKNIRNFLESLLRVIIWI